MNPALRETWRPFVGKTNGGAERDNGGKIVAMAPNNKGSHVELISGWLENLCTSDRNSLESLQN